MPGEGSVILCLGEIKAGDEAAVQALLDRYLETLEVYARRMLRALGASRAVADEQDLAQEALLTVIDGIRKEKYNDLRDREALIKLLLFVTRRGALKLKRYQEAARRADRPGEASSPEAVAAGPPGDAAEGDRGGDVARKPGPADGLRWHCRTEELMASIAGRERSHEDLVAIREEVRKLLGILDDERDRHLLLLKLEGYTHAEIARRFDCSERTVSLRFRQICETIRRPAT